MYQLDSAPWLEFFAWNTDGSAKTDLVFNTAGISITVRRDNLADSAALTLSAASGPTDYAAGKFHQMNSNKYRVGISTASISSFTGKISVEGVYTGGVITGTTEKVAAYNPANNPANAASVNAEVLDVLNVDTFAELAAVPSATSSLKDKITWLFMWARNRATQTASERKLYADDATTVVSTETVSDDGTTYAKGEAS